MQTNSLLRTLFEYKAWANDDLFDVLQSLSDDEHSQEKHDATRILNHVYVVDRIFASHAQRVPHPYNAVNTPDTPHLADLCAEVRKSDEWFIEYVSSASEADLAEDLDFRFVDGSPGRMTRGEMLAHVITHGNYHRGAVGRILSQAAMPIPRDTKTDALTAFLHAPDRLHGERT